MKTAFLHGRSFRPDGSIDSMWTKEVPAKHAPLAHHLKGLSYTATGYGKRIPTSTMVFFNGRWRRVYVCCFSNSGTAYIGQWVIGRGPEITVQGGVTCKSLSPQLTRYYMHCGSSEIGQGRQNTE